MTSRVVAPLSWSVLAAVVVGLAMGALACAAALGGGSGHVVHAGTMSPGAAPHDAHDEAHHEVHHQGHHEVHHGGHVVVVAGDEPLARSPAAAGDTSSGPVVPGSQGHPGMACVVVVDLVVHDSVLPGPTGRVDPPRPAPPGECIGDLDPPVPRFS